MLSRLAKNSESFLSLVGLEKCCDGRGKGSKRIRSGATSNKWLRFIDTTTPPLPRATKRRSERANSFACFLFFARSLALSCFFASIGRPAAGKGALVWLSPEAARKVAPHFASGARTNLAWRAVISWRWRQPASCPARHDSGAGALSAQLSIFEATARAARTEMALETRKVQRRRRTKTRPPLIGACQSGRAAWRRSSRRAGERASKRPLERESRRQATRTSREPLGAGALENNAQQTVVWLTRRTSSFSCAARASFAAQIGQWLLLLLVPPPP